MIILGIIRAIHIACDNSVTLIRGTRMLGVYTFGVVTHKRQNAYDVLHLYRDVFSGELTVAQHRRKQFAIDSSGIVKG